MTDNKAVMKMALDALTESVDLVNNEYIEAVELYSGYPSRQHRLTAFKTALDAHNAAIDSLGFAIPQPEQPTETAKLQWGQCVECDLPTPAAFGPVAHCQRDQPFFSAQQMHEYVFADRLQRQAIAQPEQLAATTQAAVTKSDLVYVYWSGYTTGHHHTVEGQYTDVTHHYARSHHAEVVHELISEGCIAQPATERNFCPRCGKRLGGVDDVHTCTPPVREATK